MKALEQHIQQMNQLLQELIQVATTLRDVSLQVISEEELAPLQKRQEEILSELEKIDHQLQQQHARQIPAAVQENFHNQLEKFQQLNQEYVQNVNNSHGLIQFELRRLSEESELSPSFTRRKKTEEES